MYPALTKIRHAPLDTFVLMKVAPQRPRVRLENMEIELDKILKLRHAHTHALQENIGLEETILTCALAVLAASLQLVQDSRPAQNALLGDSEMLWGG